MKISKFKKYFVKHKNKYVFLFAALTLLVIYFFLYKIYIPRVNAFGCFDDCNNFMGGYFLMHGKKLFSQIFFNHNPLMAYVSLFVQYLSHPQNLYELVLRHRQFLLLFGLVFNLILVFRFGIKILGFILIYEFTKFYLFGDRFLAEGFIVYALIYLVGLAFLKFNKQKIQKLDFILSVIFAWFIIFMREPYVPIVFLLFLYIIWDKNKKQFLTYLSSFIFISILTIFYHNASEFYFNVVTANLGTTFNSEAKSTGLIGVGFVKLFLYPFDTFFEGTWNYFRYILVSLSFGFIISSVVLFLNGKKKLIFFIYLLLGLLNIRYVSPGTTYYGAFHMLCWYGVFIFLSFMILPLIFKKTKIIAYFLILFYMGIFLFNLLSPLSFIHSNTNPYQEFITNYGVPLQVGTVVNKLSKPSDTLFLDGFNDIIYWQAQRLSPYKYSWYTSLMPMFKKYTDERLAMFKNTPPDFYYGTCPKEKDAERMLPNFVKQDYLRLDNDNKPSCLWVRKTKLNSITQKQWTDAKESLYTLNDNL